MSSSVALEVKGLTKTYKSILGEAGGPVGSQALKDFSLSVLRGDSVGIIGHNGAGKSTALKIITGITEPDSGTMKINGRLAAVVGLAAGFKADLTGRENIFIRGALLGQSRKDLKDRLEWIIDFADIGDYIDMPLRTYSKGMRARLGFAVTFSFDPEILVVDETMAAGDELFKRRAFDRLHEIRRAGATILLVTHSLGQIVNLCNRALLMDRGEVLGEGDPRTIRERYQTLMLAPSSERPQLREYIRDELNRGNSEVAPQSSDLLEPRKSTLRIVEKAKKQKTSTPNGGNIRTVTIHDKKGKKTSSVDFLDEIELRARMKCSMVFNGGEAHFTICDQDGHPLASCRGQLSEKTPKQSFEAGELVEFSAFLKSPLGEGRYTVDCSVFGFAADDVFLVHQQMGAAEFSVPQQDKALAGVVNLTTTAVNNAASGSRK